MLIAFLKRFYFLLLIVAIIIGVISFGPDLPLYYKQVAFSVSDSIRSILMFALPLLVLPYIINSVSLMKSRGLFLLISLVVLITVSNFVSSCMGGALAMAFVPLMSLKTSFNPGDAETLMPLFTLNLPDIISIEIVLILGFIIGLIQGGLQNAKFAAYLEKFTKLSNFFFHKIFIPLMPLYIFGNMLKIDQENDFAQVFSDFGHVISLVVMTQVTYITILFWMGSRFSLKRTFESIRNALSAWVLGFSTMSSLVTMPVTLEAAEKNLKDKTIAHLAITSTVNCHTIGDCIAMMAIAMTVLLMSNGMVEPNLITFLGFAFIFSLAQFTAVSVPGGSVVIIIPLLIKYFKFSPEMVGLVATLSVFMEPIGTANNVHGNSAFALLIKRFVDRFSQKIFT